jgi:hypothetical protein
VKVGHSLGSQHGQARCLGAVDGPTVGQAGRIDVTELAYSKFACRPVAWFALGLVLIGCAEKPPAEESDLRLLSVMYGQFRASHRGELPQDEKEFKNFIANERGHVLTNSGISNVDALFVSQRDGKPYVVKYRSTKDWLLEEMVAYEQTGEDGVRQVANDMGRVMELTDEQFQARIAEPK